jgi:aspartokinase-like uncharacterized kinase
VDAVVKVGGSLSENPDALKQLCFELSRIAQQFRVVVVPGGGKFADVVREFDAKFGLSSWVAHRMAILAMDKYGLLLGQLIPNSIVCDDLAVAQEAAGSGRVAVFRPSKHLFDADPFEPSWNVTSDSIAAYLATQLAAPKVIFATDMDGIYTADPKTHPNTTLYHSVSAEALRGLSARTSVDCYLPQFLLTHKLDCYVVNGAVPSRIREALAGTVSIGTHILPAVNTQL